MGRRRHLGRVAAAILVVGLLVAGCGGSEPDVPPIADLDLVPGQDVTVEGVVVENSVDPCRFPEDHDEPCVMDGGEVLTIDADGTEVHVHYGGGEWPPCDNVDALYDGEAARVGARVTVFAEVVADHHSGAHLDTCGSDDYRIDSAD